MDDSLRPLRLLSLDGGGIRGLSSLYILKRIMTAVKKKAGSTQGLLYPYEYFDLIAGTSTGGLIAVMLGVLRMDIDTCIREYIAMAPNIFPVERLFSGSTLGKLVKVARGRQRFDAQPFETIVKKLIADHLKTRSLDGENTTLGFEASTSQPCKVFVCVTSEKLRKHFRFRSYESSQDVIDDCLIWEACRATSAAPTIFPPIMIGNPSTAYVDGGLGYNNPVRPLIQEAVRIWPERNIGCIVSIGTGIPEWKDVGRKIRPLFETLKAISVDTETVAREVQEEIRSRYGKPSIYFRFNVQHGLEQVGLEEWKEFDRTKVATEDYLNIHSENVDSCASQICKPNDDISWIMRPSQATPSLSTVPFLKDPNFVKRNDFMTKLDSILNESGYNRAALHGLGGIGKSQIAIEYSYLVKAKTPSPWTFWVYASNANRAEQSFRDIASKVKLPGHDDPKVDILPLVSRWLDDEQNGSWLMILDNADNSEILLQPRSNNADFDGNTADSKRSLMSFIPQKSHGKVLVTSRDRNAAFELVGNHDSLVKVDPMSVSESLDLLRTKLGIDPVMENDAVELLEELEHIPLAITQAGAYIRQLEPFMTLASYLLEFHRNKSNQTALLNKNSKDLRRDETVSNSIIVTWEISFNQISKQYPSSARLLSLMSMFHRQSIPDFLIREENDDENLAFLDRINPLVNFSLLTVESGGKFFDMHRLVQMATRTWLEANQSLSNWKAEAIEKMAETFPNGKFENWEVCELLWPHAEEIITYEALNKEIKLHYASLLHSTAWYVSERGNNGLAVQRYEQCLKIRDQFLDTEDPRVLVCMGGLGLSYSQQGRWEKAEKLQLQTMKMYEKVLGAEHPKTLNSIANLAMPISHQGRWKEAEELEVKVMNMRKKVLGEEHPSTLISIANLAMTISKQGRWKEAEELEVEVMNMRKKVLGEEHPETLNSIANLAMTISHQGRWKEAEELEVKVMNTRKKVLGAEHSSTLNSIANLAATISDQGRWKEAEELGVEVMNTRKKVLGAEHPDTLTSIGNLATTISDQGRWKEAEELEVDVINTRKKVLGAEHPETLIGIANLATMISDQGRWKEAEELGVEVMNTRKKVLGAEHPSTLNSMHNLAFTYESQNRRDEAIDLMKSVVSLRTDTIGPNHPRTLESVEALNKWLDN